MIPENSQPDEFPNEMVDPRCPRETMRMFGLAIASLSEPLPNWHADAAFLAAGRLAYGCMEVIHEFPEDWLNQMGSRDAIGDRIEDASVEYLILFRGAWDGGYTSALTDRLAALLGNFKTNFEGEITRWRVNLELSGDSGPDLFAALSGSEMLALKRAGEMLRQGLAGATHGLEALVPAMANSVLLRAVKPDSKPTPRTFLERLKAVMKRLSRIHPGSSFTPHHPRLTSWHSSPMQRSSSRNSPVSLRFASLVLPVGRDRPQSCWSKIRTGRTGQTVNVSLYYAVNVKTRRFLPTCLLLPYFFLLLL